MSGAGPLGTPSPPTNRIIIITIYLTAGGGTSIIGATGQHPLPGLWLIGKAGTVPNP